MSQYIYSTEALEELRSLVERVGKGSGEVLDALDAHLKLRTSNDETKDASATRPRFEGAMDELRDAMADVREAFDELR